MKFPPLYTITPDIQKLLYECDVLTKAFSMQNIPEQSLAFHRNQSLLKSSLYSARIEGNPLTEETIPYSSEKIHLKEIQQLSTVYSFLQKQTLTLDISIIKRLHKMALKHIHSDAGQLRTEESAIYNSAGIAVYVTPSPEKIVSLLDDWISYVTTSTDHPLIVAGAAHIWFEKIHPFLDGNGRIGRILSHAILLYRSYNLIQLIPIEEYFEHFRFDYYRALEKNSQDITEFIHFFLSSFYEHATTTLQKIMNTTIDSDMNTMLPRRLELFHIITDHKLVSFNFLSRRFLKIPKRTLHYDLAWLVKNNFVVKLGKTNGVMYRKK